MEPHSISKIVADVLQPRSQYQLEHFVIGQHDTPEMRYHQLCLELQDMEYRVALSYLNEKQKRLKIEKLRAKGDPISLVKAEKAELGLNKMQVIRVGTERELDILREMFRRSPKFTREQIDAAQARYWHLRLDRQYQLQKAAGALSSGQLDAMIQAGMMDRPEPIAELES